MRAMWVGVLATAVVGLAAATPLAAQHQGESATRPKMASGPATGRRAGEQPQVVSSALNTQHGSAAYASGKRQWGPLLTYQRNALQLSQELTAHKSPGRNKLDVEALGRALTGEESQLSTLERTATGADRQALAQAQAHEGQARTHYQELVHGGWDARHAAALHQELQLVDRSLHRSGGDPSTAHIVIHRAFGGQPRDTGGNVIRRAIP